jgi:hypothetical protein
MGKGAPYTVRTYLSAYSGAYLPQLKQATLGGFTPYSLFQNGLGIWIRSSHRIAVEGRV